MSGTSCAGKVIPINNDSHCCQILMSVLQTMVDVSKYVLIKYFSSVALATMDIYYTMRSFVQVNHNFIN